MPVTLEAGDRAPSFTLKDQDGNVHKLADYRGRSVVLYFYPRDATPGCTTQACSLRDEHADIAEEEAVVLGVSPDDADSHQAFRAEHGLPFPLLVDPGQRVATRYGAWGEKVQYGRRVVGMTRCTFVIGPDGTLVKVWKRAKAADHGAAVLKALRSAR